MDCNIYKLADCYLQLLAWFIASGIPSPFLGESLKLKSEIETVLRVCVGTNLTGVELARYTKDKYSRDTLSEVPTLYATP